MHGCKFLKLESHEGEGEEDDDFLLKEEEEEEEGGEVEGLIDDNATHKNSTRSLQRARAKAREEEIDQC